MAGNSGFPTIPDQEFKERLSRFKEKMAANGLDLVALFSNLLDPSSVMYFTNVSPVNESAAMLIPLEGEPVLMSGQACHEWSRHKSKIKDIRIMPEVGEVAVVEYGIAGQISSEDLFREMKSKYNIRKIGIVGDLIFPYGMYKNLEKVFPGVDKVSAEMMLYELRAKKSENEIACIKKACNIISKAFEFAEKRIKPGVTELDIQADIESQLLRLGAEGVCNSWTPMIPSGPVNSHLCVNRNTLRKVKKSEIIDLQAGALYEGYNGVICTPVVLGKIPDEIRNAVLTAHEALKIVSAQLKPGVSSRQLFRAYIDFLKSKGYEKYSPYGSVHSLGMLECETPFFSANKDVYLGENNVVAIDVYFKGLPWGSFRIEDVFVVRKDGAELLTSFNKKYIPKRFK